MGFFGTKDGKVYTPDSLPEYQLPESYGGNWAPVVLKKKPYKCPVCNGKGIVPNGFYSCVGDTIISTTTTIPEQCRSCKGTGVIWNG